jgi:GTPase Era involved in 16S rRNA processing
VTGSSQTLTREMEKFINTAAGESLLRVSHGLEPCTTKVEHVRCTVQFKGSFKQVVFVDTPAFPEPGSDNMTAGLDVARKIQDWARKT